VANPEWESYDTQCQERTRDLSHGVDHRCELERGHKLPHVSGDYWWEAVKVITSKPTRPTKLTRRQWIDAVADHERRRKAVEESSETRHARYLADALKNGIRNLTAADYQRARELATDASYPLDAPAMFNATSEPCDARCGPCSCGAWHKEGI
jgi:hypothetical protein